ncbi:hypothetical protein I545_6128 [Mycobacterium kansasii 662]|uniref:Uncharacterized protein n=2 Tax=Mycobacterium kansasii TaxID=1768 RepID=A0A1V3X4A5_MYCKA|nr:hypothetical protein I547_5749 [Mycobacterium kansasii 824]EUA09141.1 hypothetical protein I545_6128 [Mycobacterium kansasii 662]OOK73922.1 hypothetical protein BZL30_4724 [Mycobacterium kansasii]OOK77140.1 hypothetical protein BZL29_4007 [Mycobacterium kansasii]
MRRDTRAMRGDLAEQVVLHPEPRLLVPRQETFWATRKVEFRHG